MIYKQPKTNGETPYKDAKGSVIHGGDILYKASIKTPILVVFWQPKYNCYFTKHLYFGDEEPLANHIPDFTYVGGNVYDNWDVLAAKNHYSNRLDKNISLLESMAAYSALPTPTKPQTIVQQTLF